MWDDFLPQMLGFANNKYHCTQPKSPVEVLMGVTPLPDDIAVGSAEWQQYVQTPLIHSRPVVFRKLVQQESSRFPGLLENMHMATLDKFYNGTTILAVSGKFSEEKTRPQS